MQVQNISNPQTKLQSFQGKIDIIPGDLSYQAAKNVRKAYSAMSEVIKEKPYNLLIRQNHKRNSIDIIAQDSKTFGKKNPPISVSSIGLGNNDLSNNDEAIVDFYSSVAEYVASEYEAKNPTNLTFIDKTKNLLIKFGKKFMTAIQDE